MCFCEVTEGFFSTALLAAELSAQMLLPQEPLTSRHPLSVETGLLCEVFP